MGNCCKKDTGAADDSEDDSKRPEENGLQSSSFKPSVVVPDANRMADVVGELFVKLKSLGHGATSEVFEVQFQDDSERGSFALKVMLRTAYDNLMLFEHECSIMRQLDHPNIVKFIDAYEDEYHLYILTEVCSGGELFDRIVKSHHFSETKAAGLIKTMLEMIKTMHDRDIVHRDLKPENFVFASPDENSVLKLVDFGVAKKVAAYEVYGDIVGTAFYLAPESANPRTRRTGTILKASDMWSIGVITYVILTGCPPFYGRSNHAIFNSILRGKVSFKRHKVSEGAKDFIMSLLKQNPAERMDVYKALEHPWIKGKAPDVAINPGVIGSLKNFTNHCGLVRALARLMVDKMNSRDKSKLESEFKKLDMSHDGMIHAFELSSAMRHAGYTDETARREATSMMRGADINLDGTVDLVEYETARQPVLSRNFSNIKRTFKMLSEGGEFIEKDNINRVFGWQNREEDLHDMFDEIDVDHDGKIDFSDFVTVMRGGQWRQNLPDKHDASNGEVSDEEVKIDENAGKAEEQQKQKPPTEKAQEPSVDDAGEQEPAVGDAGEQEPAAGDGDAGEQEPAESPAADETKDDDDDEETSTIALPEFTEEDKIEVTSTFRYHHSMGIKPSVAYLSIN